MKILQEITKWEDTTPNHIYHINDAGKLVAYQREGTTEIKTFSTPMSFDRGRRKFITLEEIAEAKPAGAKEVKGSNGKIYYVQDGKCTCTGFKFRGSCKHVK